ncbi:MAG: hypothetical protein ACYCW6_08940 [Candidatus Xenobia bacterium]
MKILRLAALLLLLAAAAGAQALPLRLNRLILYWHRPYADSIWIKVHVRNTSDQPVQQPFVVRLYVRRNSTEAWRPIKVWHETEMAAGAERTFMYQPSSEIMDPVLFTGQFQARFEVIVDDKIIDSVEGAYP